MNTATGFGLYLLGSFVLVAAFVVTPSIKYYLGAVVIFLFMGGVFFAWLNTIRETNNMIKSPMKSQGIDEKKDEEGPSAAPMISAPAPQEQKQSSSTTTT